MSRFENAKVLDEHGQFFVTRVVPKDGSMEVFVSDPSGANLDYAKLHMLATITVEHRRWFMIPAKYLDHFKFVYPSDFNFSSMSELRLLLDDGRQNEIIVFKRW